MRFKSIILYSLSFLFIQSIQSQLCQGSLGDPIVNNTFGQGTNPGPPTSAITTYQYFLNDCPGDGFYTVRNNTNSCFGNTWHSLNSDHTGNGNGYFMLVNASHQPSDFYVDTVRGLCGNTTYEFAAWIINVILPSACGGNANQPNLTFKIERFDGTVLQTYNTGNITSSSSPTWKQYGNFFTTPNNVTDIILRITNNAAGGCGNDLAIDDISFRPCGPLLTTAFSGSVSNSKIICEGVDNIETFTSTVTVGFTNPYYQWQEKIGNGTWTDIVGANNLEFIKNFQSNFPVGDYEYRITVSEFSNIGIAKCRINSQSLKITIKAKANATVSNSGAVCQNKTVTLNASGGNEYAWSGPNGFSQAGSTVQLTNIQLNQAGKYFVEVKNSDGCLAKDSSIVVVHPNPIISISSTKDSICAGDNVQLIASGGTEYLWSPSSSLTNSDIYNPFANPEISTNYKVIVTNLFSCKDSASKTITVFPLPIINASSDKSILFGQQILLNASSNDINSRYLWSPQFYINDINALQPIVNPPVDTKYILSATSLFGCKSMPDTVLVRVYKEIIIPNAFSPNSDGVNDTWNITELASNAIFELKVFSRVGQVIFNTRKNPIVWNGLCNGTPCNTGVYYYVLNLISDKEVKTGSVLILK